MPQHVKERQVAGPSHPDPAIRTPACHDPGTQSLSSVLRTLAISTPSTSETPKPSSFQRRPYCCVRHPQRIPCGCATPPLRTRLSRIYRINCNNPYFNVPNARQHRPPSTLSLENNTTRQNLTSCPPETPITSTHGAPGARVKCQHSDYLRSVARRGPDPPPLLCHGDDHRSCTPNAWYLLPHSLSSAFLLSLASLFYASFPDHVSFSCNNVWRIHYAATPLPPGDFTRSTPAQHS
jgi:hypothetical protein